MSKSLHTLAIIFLIVVPTALHAGKDWNNHRAAVSLTYDDALNVHLDNAAPALEQRGYRGTFYITAYAEPFRQRLSDWRKLAQSGHELGNHTLFHPCLSTLPGREWVMPHRDLNKWSKQRFLENVQMTSTMLEAIDGKAQRSFAYTCGDTTANGEPFMAEIASQFVAARGVSGKNQPFATINFANLASHAVDNDSAEQLIAQVDEAIAKDAWVIFLFHGVGGEHALDVSIKAHDALLDYLKSRTTDVWVAPVVEVAEYARKAVH